MFDKVLIFQFEAGEASKNLNTVSKLYEYLIINKFDRKDILFALGGGVVGDLTGFTASTYLRGIKFVQLPTSLLSQVDSSIGGKTGVTDNAGTCFAGVYERKGKKYVTVVLKCDRNDNNKSYHLQNYPMDRQTIYQHIYQNQ